MSGGQLVVIDRSGRDVKRYELSSGLVTLGSHPSCDIRVMLPSVDSHHATVAVHSNQTVVRSVSGGETLVNGALVSVHALRHRDVITLGDRSLRWEYSQPQSVRSPQHYPVLSSRAGRGARGGRGARRGRGRLSEAAARRLDPSLRLVLEMSHRSSMPGGTKQVAIVQPQMRAAVADVNDSTSRAVTVKSQRQSTSATKRASRQLAQSEQGSSTEAVDGAPVEGRANKRASTNTPNKGKKVSPKSGRGRTSRGNAMGIMESATETKASQWIASRKSSPKDAEDTGVPISRDVRYVHVATPRPPVSTNTPSKMTASTSPRRVLTTKPKAVPLRTLLLRKMVTPKVTDRATLKVSPKATPVRATKVTPRRSPREMLVGSPKVTNRSPRTSKATPYKGTPKVVKIKAPLTIDANKKAALLILTRTPKSRLLAQNLTPKTATPTSLTKTPSPTRADNNSPVTGMALENSTRRSGRRTPTNDSVTGSCKSGRSDVSFWETTKSPLPPSPKKSALKKPSATKSRNKSESIKFDLSNLEGHHESSDVLLITNTTASNSASENDYTLAFSDSDTSKSESPSPRRPIHMSRSAKILEKSLGTPVKSPRSTTPTLQSPSVRKSYRGTIILQKALDSTLESSVSSEGSRKSNTSKNTSVKSNKNIESYSIVDLVSMDSNGTQSSLYNSVDSNDSLRNFGTPILSDRRSSGRKAKSSIAPVIVGSSTPLVQKTPRSRSTGVLSIGPRSVSTPPYSDAIATTTRRSKSLSTPIRRGKTVTINSTVSPSTLRNTSSRYSGGDNSVLIFDSPAASPKRINKSDESSISKSRRGHGDTFLQSSNVRSGSSMSSDSPPKSTKRSSRGDKTATPKSHSRSSDDTTFVESSNCTVDNNSTFIVTSSPQSKKSNVTSPKKRNSPKNTSASKQTPRLIEEQVTPKNTVVCEGVETPILNIQSLLETSKSNAHSRGKQRASTRKTIGPIHRNTKIVLKGAKTEPKRLGRKSYRLNLSNVKKVLIRRQSNESGVSDKTDENAPKPSDEDKVTPKSTVKLVPEGVKQKHSTAKKPKSKRSVIDDLNQSDVVKILFNSPVKRKLSQSMTEFGEKLLSETSTKSKRTRRTIAATPNETFVIENARTPQVPTEIFVSPLNTPSCSPNLTGIKKLFGKRTPRSNLSDVEGVDTLLRTPQIGVSAGKGTSKVAKLNKSENDLSHVKKVSTVKSPKNDLLLNVSGVKTLFQSKKKTRSPRNDLSDVRGVKQLFTRRKTPRNDLTNIEGVKRLFARNSPRNDLRDVRDIKRILRLERSQNGLDDMSGVEELFNNSTTSQKEDAETLFDRLVGKPVIKATYSKSFIAKRDQKRAKNKASQSLIVPVEGEVEHFDKWLEQELMKRVSKPSASIISKSKNTTVKPNKTRELQRLATDTVEGGTPMRNSRVRGRTPRMSSLGVDKSLPLKKRSLTESVLRRVNTTNDSDVYLLPIKKRVIVHSTPVKGKRQTILATDIGRVSPITATEDENPTSVKVTPKILCSPKSRSSSQTQLKPKRGRKPAKSIQTEEKKTKPSPKQSSRTKPTQTEGQTSQLSPKQPSKRSTRAKSKQTKAVESQPTPKKSPKLLTRAKSKQVEVKSAQPDPKQSSKQSTRRKTKQTEAEIIKLSPKRATRAAKAKAQTSPVQKTTRGRKVNKETSLKTTKKGRLSLVITKKAPIMTPENPLKRTRQTKKSPIKPSPKTNRTAVAKRVAEKNVSSKKQSPQKPRRTRATIKEDPKVGVVTPKPVRNTRAKQSKSNTLEAQTKAKRKSVGPSLVVAKPSPRLKPRPTKGKTSLKDVSAEQPKGRTSRKVETQEQATKGRKRDTASIQPVEAPKTKRTRFAPTTPQKTEQTKRPVRGRKTTESQVQEKALVSDAKNGNRRGEVQQIPAEEPKKEVRRGRREAIAQPAKNEPAEEKTTRGRKRKADTSVENVVPVTIARGKRQARGAAVTAASQPAPTARSSRRK